MKILLYHFGYRGDILVSGQNFTRELKKRFPEAHIDLMIRPRMTDFVKVVESLDLYKNILLGEKEDFKRVQDTYDDSYMIDECVYPEGNLRTPFTKAGFAFCLHQLQLITTKEEKDLARSIISKLSRPIISFQEDMSRKWPQKYVDALQNKLSKLGTVLVVGPNQKYLGSDKSLTFQESAALIETTDIYVGIDSGIAHAAALVGVQTILLPPVFPEYWISPTEYANPFIPDDELKHVSVRPHNEDFCGHYFCLKSTPTGGIKRFCGDPLMIKCACKKSFGVFKRKCCFLNINDDDFYMHIKTALMRRSLAKYKDGD